MSRRLSEHSKHLACEIVPVHDVTKEWNVNETRRNRKSDKEKENDEIKIAIACRPIRV